MRLINVLGKTYSIQRKIKDHNGIHLMLHGKRGGTYYLSMWWNGTYHFRDSAKRLKRSGTNESLYIENKKEESQ